ncbi:MAG: hypothetical protein P8X70_00965 [Nanoarchaeota archaeon]
MNVRMRMNKKGVDLVSVWWLIIIVGVALVIAASLTIFHSAEIDIREVEAEILYDKIAECILENGFLVDDILRENFDIFKSCEIAESLFEEGSDYYFNVRIFNEADVLMKEIRKGDYSIEKDCEVVEEIDGKSIKARNYPRCYDNEEFVFYLDSGNIRELKVKILTSSNQKGKKVSFAG